MNKPALLGKRIPTFLGILILIGGLIAGVVLVGRQQGTETKAGPTESPKNVRISNRGTNTFSISWTTDTPVTGFVKYSENPTKIVSPAGDVRDQISGSAQSYTNHHVNVTNLKADTTYYFVIGSGPMTYNDDGKPFQVRTGPQVIPPPEDVISGKIVNSAGSAASGAIIFIEAEGGEALSTVSKTDGTWRLNLAAVRNKDGQVLTYDKDKSVLSIFIQAGTAGTATAITNTGKDNPVPDIVLGKNQSFVDSIPAPLAQTQESTSAAKATAGFKELSVVPTQTMLVDIPAEASSSFSILNPALNGEMVATTSPEFRGKALPGTDIKITVHSAVEMSQLIKADVNGNWTWSAPQQLEPGIHTLTLQYTDQSGKVVNIERTFTVLSSDAGGGLPAFTATPSATPIITPTATPSATPTEIPTPTPTPTEIVMPATESSELVETGVEWIAYLMVGMGLGMFVFGGMIKKKIEMSD